MGVVPSSADGVTVAFDVWGSGEPTLVFIHGLSGSRTYFDHQVNHFRASHRVVAVDLPGHGASGRARQTWTIAAYGEDVASVADHLGLDDVVLVGHSLGGDVTVEAARRLGGRTRGLVWIDSYRSFGNPKREDQIDQQLAPYRVDFVAATEDLARRNFAPHADPAMVERVAAEMSAADPDVAVQLLGAKMANERALLAGLDQIGVPVVAINPDFKPNDEGSLDAHGVRFVVMSGVGHFAMLEDPDTFNDVLSEVVGQFSVLG